ncbi:hypothetical protein PTTG_26322 [Puccinia triticina 1-1 BBBD Race 1]|uniref:Uncharacterized protein n=1 Tax=Puccinia triticina (isolate 1-1 / race 1 (BBBD)) TaxID=630390 RepID=A0A180GUS4_PUCT1|nr:hypothetical protein PTTG_26322 [Puccinia triticina 1-1 BBBD Race 1]
MSAMAIASHCLMSHPHTACPQFCSRYERRIRCFILQTPSMAPDTASIPFFWPPPQSNNPQNILGQIPADSLHILSSLDLSRIPPNCIGQFLADKGLLPVPSQPFPPPFSSNYSIVSNPITPQRAQHPTRYNVHSPASNTEGSRLDSMSELHSSQSSQHLDSGSDSETSPQKKIIIPFDIKYVLWQEKLFNLAKGCLQYVKVFPDPKSPIEPYKVEMSTLANKEDLDFDYFQRSIFCHLDG